MNDELLTTDEAAARLGVTPVRVRAMIGAGRLPAEKFGHVHMIKAEDLKLVAGRKAGRPPKSVPAAQKPATGHASAKDGVSTGGKKGRERKQGAK
jgi:excisionase family DNA binding protein